MGLNRIRSDMTQEQAMGNMMAVVGDSFFDGYLCSGFELSSYLVGVSIRNGRGGVRKNDLRLAGVRDMIVDSCKYASDNGALVDKTSLVLRPSIEMIRAMNFKPELHSGGDVDLDDMELPVEFNVVHMIGGDDVYCFCTNMGGFKKSYFEAEEFDYENAQGKVDVWHGKVLGRLEKMLPHGIEGP